MRTILTVMTVAMVSLFSTEVRAHGSVEKGERDNLRGVRFGEVLVVRGGPLVFKAGVYNTVGFSDCPEAQWKALDAKKLKKEFQAKGVILNGPRYFLMDKITGATPGDEAIFGTLKMRRLAVAKIGLGTLMRGGSKPYEENEITRNTQYLFRKGGTVYELVSPKKDVYVMQTYAQIVDPKLDEAGLAKLGGRLNLPEGWQYRVRKLDADLTVRAWGRAYVVQDEFKNTYQRIEKEPS